MKVAAHNGFTVIELLIGIVAAAILALAAGVLLENSYKGWVRGQAAADLEREAALTIHTLELAVRGASNTLHAGANSLKFITPNTARNIGSFTNIGGTLVYNDSLVSMVLVSNHVASFSSAATNRLVRVSLTLTNNENMRMACTNVWIRMRNHP